MMNYFYNRAATVRKRSQKLDNTVNACLRARLCGFFFGILFFIPLSWATPKYDFSTKAQAAQFQHLIKELRCLVCQNQDLADSEAPLAEDLRQSIYEQVISGQSDDEITRYLTSRYGDFILFKPPVKPLTWVLWFGPLMFLIVGFGIFMTKVRKYHEA